MATNSEINLAEISEQIKNAATLSEVQDIIERNGFDWDEVKSKILIDKELSEGELEAVSGGGFLGDLWKFTYGRIEDLLKDLIDRKTTETTTCTYSKDKKTRTCTTKTTVKW